MSGSLLPLRVRAARVTRCGKRLIGPVDLMLDGPGITMIIGPNGSGKTSLLRMLHGLERLSGGAIEWAVPLEEARRGQAFVFQAPILLRRSVEENLAFPLLLRHTSRQGAFNKAEKWAACTGLEPALKRSASSLSGGERQKLALARALIGDPEILFLDEPCTSLDGSATRDIEAILLKAARTKRLIMATHDMGQARRLADEVIFLLGGLIHEQGPAAAFFARQITHEARGFLKGEIVV